MSGPDHDEDIAPWVRGLGLDGLVDLHVRLLPERMLHKVCRVPRLFVAGVVPEAGSRRCVRSASSASPRCVSVTGFCVRVLYDTPAKRLNL